MQRVDVQLKLNSGEIAFGLEQDNEDNLSTVDFIGQAVEVVVDGFLGLDGVYDDIHEVVLTRLPSTI